MYKLSHTNSQVVFNKIKMHPQRNRPYYHLVKQSQELLNHPDWEVIVEHCYRESNKAADFLANMGIAQSTVSVTFEFPPDSLRKILYEDNSFVAVRPLFDPLLAHI